MQRSSHYEYFLRCTFPNVFCKAVKKYFLISLFTQYRGSLMTTNKMHYTVFCFRISGFDHQPQDATTIDSGLVCFTRQLLLLYLFCLTRKFVLFILNITPQLNSDFRRNVLGEIVQKYALLKASRRGEKILIINKETFRTLNLEQL